MMSIKPRSKRFSNHYLQKDLRSLVDYENDFTSPSIVCKTIANLALQTVCCSPTYSHIKNTMMLGVVILARS